LHLSFALSGAKYGVSVPFFSRLPHDSRGILYAKPEKSHLACETPRVVRDAGGVLPEIFRTAANVCRAKLAALAFISDTHRSEKITAS
jgi:hypothetical protein